MAKKEKEAYEEAAHENRLYPSPQILLDTNKQPLTEYKFSENEMGSAIGEMSLLDRVCDKLQEMHLVEICKIDGNGYLLRVRTADSLNGG